MNQTLATWVSLDSHETLIITLQFQKSDPENASEDKQLQTQFRNFITCGDLTSNPPQNRIKRLKDLAQLALYFIHQKQTPRTYHVHTRYTLNSHASLY